MSLKIKINPHTPNYNTKFIFILDNYDEQHGVTYDKRNVPQERAFVYGKTEILVSSNTHNIYIYISFMVKLRFWFHPILTIYIYIYIYIFLLFTL